MRKSENGFGAVGIITVIVVAGLIGAVGWLVYSQQSSNTKTTSKNQQEVRSEEAKTTDTTKPQANAAKYLEIEEYGVKVELSEGIKDAYYEMENGYPLLSVHSLDKYPGCNKIASVSKAKIGDDRFGSPLTKEDLEKSSKLQIDDTYFWIEVSNGGSCSDPGGSKPDEIEITAREEFSSAKLVKL